MLNDYSLGRICKKQPKTMLAMIQIITLIKDFSFGDFKMEIRSSSNNFSLFSRENIDFKGSMGRKTSLKHVEIKIVNKHYS